MIGGMPCRLREGAVVALLGASACSKQDAGPPKTAEAEVGVAEMAGLRLAVDASGGGVDVRLWGKPDAARCPRVKDAVKITVNGVALDRKSSGGVENGPPPSSCADARWSASTIPAGTSARVEITDGSKTAVLEAGDLLAPRTLAIVNHGPTFHSGEALSLAYAPETDTIGALPSLADPGVSYVIAPLGSAPSFCIKTKPAGAPDSAATARCGASGAGLAGGGSDVQVKGTTLETRVPFEQAPAGGVGVRAERKPLVGPLDVNFEWRGATRSAKVTRCEGFASCLAVPPPPGWVRLELVAPPEAPVADGGRSAGPSDGRRDARAR